MEHFFLHVLLDEKVVDSFITMMEEAFPNESTYLIIAKDGAPKRVKQKESVISFDENSKELKHYLSRLMQYRHVCLHSMVGKKFYSYVNHDSISWVIWGSDLYGPLLRFKGYNIYYDKKKQYKVRAGRLPVWLYRLMVNFRDYPKVRREESVINKLSYVITDNGCDYDVFKKYYGEKRIKFYGTINYYPIENLIDPSKQKEECAGNAIWVGNSADANGNHVWVFEMLSNYSNGIKVMSPISYGDPRFMKYLYEEGNRLLGDRFVPLKEFLPVKDYYARFLQANSFVFAHFRQCAVGNILMALFFGGKVFLSHKNPLLNMYKETGFNIFSIEDDLTEEFATKPLSREERVNNRELVKTIASHENSIKQLKNVYGQIKRDYLFRKG
ncbi:MAG: TDP-N-acetylfucosamine:lipid II N-acetylfucosaminyltransferase [Bacteroidales bacterium]|nr:TDP-N-acetylfucosamine:lipid II N-acetylfucosaminyltransferase [Bacteroidales bacterium]